MGIQIDPRVFPSENAVGLSLEKACSSCGKHCIHHKYREKNGGDTWDQRKFPSYEALRLAENQCGQRRSIVRVAAEEGRAIEVENCSYISLL